jgi:diacylglycerol kinase family enzyme
MRRALLVANPWASAFTGALHRRVVADLGEAYDLDAVWPNSAAEARQMASEAAADGFHAVIAMGGDGVVHHVANGIARTSTALGVVPAGTTNVVARILGLPQRPAKAAALLKDADITPMTLAHLATDSGVGARSEFAVFAAGIGYDADMVQIAEQRPTSKYHFGSVHYARSAAAALLTDYRRRPANLRVTCDGERRDAVAVLVQVHDPYTYFGRVPLRLDRGSSDGLTVAAIESLALRRASGVLARAVTGRDIGNVSGVSVWQDPAKVIIEAEPSSRFQADGEPLGATDWLEISPVPRGLAVLTPRKEDPPPR